MPGYVAAIDLVSANSTTHAVAEIDPQNPKIYNYKAADFSGSFNFSTGSFYFDLENATTGTEIIARYTVTSSEVIRPEPDFALKLSGNISYLARPEDVQDIEFVDEVSDEYPWRRDLVGGGELVELDTYIASTPDVAIDVVGNATAVRAHTGVDIEVIGIPSVATGILRLAYQDMPTDRNYEPSRLAVGYAGVLKDLSTLTAPEIDFLNNENDWETLFEPGYAVYHIGLAQGVLVGDLPKFFGPHHRDGLVGWMAFNEHPEDDLTVVDHSSINSTATLVGVEPQDRLWSSERGWYLNLDQSGTAVFNAYRGVVDDQTVSFWINPSSVGGSGVTTILEYGPLSFDLSAASQILAYVGTNTVSGPTRQLIDTQPVSAGQWTFFYTRKFSSTAVFGWGGNLNTSASETTVTTAGSYTAASLDDTVVMLQGGARSFGFHDLRIWDEFKSQGDMDLVRYHSPTPTICTYRPGFIQTANKRDRHGFRVLPNGFVTTDILPAWLRTVSTGLVRRYDSTGAYTGESRFKEVGLGGGRPLPSTYLLGNQFTALTAAGTAVMATTHGEMPGYNAAWPNDSYAGTYASLRSGSTSTGTLASHVWSGTSRPFPNPMVETNPNRDAIWVQGDNGAVYEVTLVGSLTNTRLVAARIPRKRSDADLEVNHILQTFNSTGSVFAVTAQGTIFTDQLSVTVSSGSIVSLAADAATGAVTVLTSGTTVVSVLHPLNLRYAEVPTGAQMILANSGAGAILSVTTDGTVYQTAYSGTLTTPPGYMYLNERIVAAAPNAWTQWTDNTNSVAFGNQQISPVAALNQNGVLEFEDSGTLLAGMYELDVISGNIGNPDGDFHGFDVQITINATTFQGVLLKGETGYNANGTDTFRFMLADGVVGDWLTSFQWTNAYSNPQRGQARQLAIYGYQLRWLSTELYRVEIAPSGTVPLITQLTVL